MSLSKARNRERMRKARSVQPVCNLTNDDAVQPKPITTVQPKLAAVGLKLEGNRIIRLEKPNSNLVQPRPPLYNPAIHGPGDTVLLQRGKRMIPTIIPRLDADGNPMPW